jgi:hypothetical protein
MEADWEIEIGGGAPLIEIDWQGFVDLTNAPELVGALSEIVSLPCLASALLRLNAKASPIFTTKCDAWPIDVTDPLEFDAEAAGAGHGFACYIDLLARSPAAWLDLEKVRLWCRELCEALHAVSLQSCRTDLVLREAVGKAVSSTMGVTAYLAACGPTRESAKERLGLALASFVDAIFAGAPHSAQPSKLQ